MRSLSSILNKPEGERSRKFHFYRRNAEHFKNWALGCQSLTISAGLIFGAFWTVCVLQEGTRAARELQKLDLLLSRQAAIEIQIEAQSSPSLANSSSAQHDEANLEGYLVDISVSITNKGNTNTTIIPPDDGTLTVHRVTFDNDLRINKAIINEDLKKWIVLRPGVRDKLAFFFKLKDPGIYHIQFRAKVEKDEIKAVTDRSTLESIEDKAVFWTAEKYLVIR